MLRFLLAVTLLVSVSSFAQTQDSLVLQPGPMDGKDAIVWSITPDSTWGWNQEATLTAWTYGGDPSYKRFYIEFDYSSIPAGAIIDSAYLFYHNNPSAPSHSGLHSGSNTFWVRRVTSSWDEDSISWNNAPSDTTQNQVQVGASTSNTMDYKIDVKNLVEDQLQYGNHGFFMRLVTEATWRAVVCASSNATDSTNHPAIKIYYTECTPPLATYTYTATGNTVDFIPLFNAPTGVSHLWDFGNGNFSIADTPTYTFPTGGVHTVCHTVTTSCSADTACQQVVLCSPPTASYTHSVDSNQVWTFVPQDTTANSYWWDFGDGTFSNNMIGVHSYSFAGLYPVCLSMTNACGVDTTCLNFEVTLVGMDEHWNPDLNVYPNPLTSVLHIENTGVNELLRIEVYDMRGVMVQFDSRPISQINLERLSSGTYLLKIIQRNGTSIVRIVKS